ncbi:ABC-type antimicrobial peptide transport system permease subunit [Anaerosolibacter carboniphilus]|uniref:ABC-type antimicrobial peptide transport system permease subunit n=1 Tax=Anaerosolibacter carboniphilus TaxID=1417629 RepID=A0A841KLC7_9FIRM|nr:ABC transporter permease [Anaerosolibacter carboniphilus]MBB6214031.1 ABC-type antimicrobial peptide transport system permease subunit [Anaerosolibacter carboniphilus]
MNNQDLFKMALGNLLRRKTRTLLTILGVVIGTSSIVVMLSLGIAMDYSFKEQLSRMGSLNLIDVNNYGFYGEGMAPGGGKELKLDDNAVNSIRQIPGVQGVMPIKTAYVRIVAGKMVGNLPVTGIQPELMEVFDFKVETGRLLMESDKDAIVFGKQTAMNFYNPRLRNPQFGPMGPEPPKVDLIGNKLTLTTSLDYGERRMAGAERNPDQKPPKLYKVKGVGILQESQNEQDYNAYMHMDTLKKIIEESERTESGEAQRRRGNRQDDQYERVSVKVKDINQVEAVQEQIKAMGFQAFSLTDMLKSMKETSRKMQAILGGIGAVSLFVAAIGITNTMVMSIYERTREIGVMKVLGADLTDIRKLFLLEAGMIGFGGGLLGLLLSYLISLGLNKIGGGFLGGMGGSTGISVIPIQLSMAALAFSTMVGIISGFSPARRAMNLSSLEAIRSE